MARFIKISEEKLTQQEDDFYISKIQLGEFFLTKVIFETKKVQKIIFILLEIYIITLQIIIFNWEINFDYKNIQTF